MSDASDEHKPDGSPPPSIADKFRQRLTQAVRPATHDPLPEPPPVPAQDPTPEPAPSTFPDPSHYPVTYDLIHVGHVNPWALSIYHTALAQLEGRQWDKARASLRRAVDAQEDFVDPHLWLGRLGRTPEERREHYSTVIALLGNHIEAMRELMVLNGQLSREEADRSERGEVAWAKSDAPIAAQGQTQRCPQCGGDLSQHVAHDGRISCHFCGYVLVLDQVGQGSGGRSLQMAMIKRRGQERVWAIGERLLHCSACGAERILPANQLSSRCPFCGSNQVIQADAVRSFEQPDGVIPFRIDEAQARAALHEALNSRLERVRSWFINNKVKDIRLWAVFLPFWVFDAYVIVPQTIRDERGSTWAEECDLSAVYQRYEFKEMIRNVAVFGGETLPRKQVERLSAFDWQAVLPYQMERLAGVEAQLYTVDYEAASLLARKRISEVMRSKYDYDPDHSDSYSVSVVAFAQHMEFRLLLCPFWVAHLLEADGDHRLALIQGQQGSVELGQASKHK